MHWVKYVEIRVFSGPYFLADEQNRIRIFPYIVDYAHIRGNTDTILMMNGKICVKQSPNFDVFHAVTSSFV